MMVPKSKIRTISVAMTSLTISLTLLHLYLVSSSLRVSTYRKPTPYDLLTVGQKIQFRKLWGPLVSLDFIQPQANPRSPSHPIVPARTTSKYYIYAKVYGGFEMIRPSICDLVTISRLLNATLVIPEIQQTTQLQAFRSLSKSSSFSYVYDEEKFIDALKNDVDVVKTLPDALMEKRRKNNLPWFQPIHSASPEFYLNQILPKLQEAKAGGIIVSTGGCLQSVLPHEYQRLRCRVAFHALQFKPEIKSLAKLMVQRLRASGPYLAYHPGLTRETLAIHGCAELFQDLHTELVQYRRAQMIRSEKILEALKVNSVDQKRNSTCPLMPEEVGGLLRALGYPSTTVIYLAGSETFGGQRILIPLRSKFYNLIDRTVLCSRKELTRLTDDLSPVSVNKTSPPPVKVKQKAGPRPRVLPPPPGRPIYFHEKEGWYGWIGETDKEPNSSPFSDRNLQAQRLVWDALDYYVSIEADAFFPGFHNHHHQVPDFSSLVMGHRLYQNPSTVTYRPDRRTVAGVLYNASGTQMGLRRNRNWEGLGREHLQKSLGLEGLVRESRSSKPALFLSQPLPECFCIIRRRTRNSHGPQSYAEKEECPETVRLESRSAFVNVEGAEENDGEEKLKESGMAEMLWSSIGR